MDNSHQLSAICASVTDIAESLRTIAQCMSTTAVTPVPVTTSNLSVDTSKIHDNNDTGYSYYF